MKKRILLCLVIWSISLLSMAMSSDFPILGQFFASEVKDNFTVLAQKTASNGQAELRPHVTVKLKKLHSRARVKKLENIEFQDDHVYIRIDDELIFLGTVSKIKEPLRFSNNYIKSDNKVKLKVIVKPTNKKVHTGDLIPRLSDYGCGFTGCGFRQRTMYIEQFELTTPNEKVLCVSTNIKNTEDVTLGECRK